MGRSDFVGAMARAIDRIERDIAELEQATRAIALQLYGTYSSYLTDLGQALRQQLILASYHICTQGYAESFLKLSLNQRQQLQQDLRQLGKKVREMLFAALQRPVAKEPPELPAAGSGLRIPHESENREVLAAASPFFQKESEPPPEGASSTESAETAELLGNPEQLVHWQQTVEMAIATILQTTSHKANHLLQQAGVLPPKLPEPLLDAAARAEPSEAAAVAGPPNLLNVLIETENADESQRSRITQLIAIHLRLPEIEFADSKVMAGRSQIRQLAAKLNKLGRDYQKKQRERAVAEAEAAWRASWFDED